jgi:uncharacterized protein YecT (DUF1311 family)
MNRSRRLLILLLFAGMLIAVAIGSYEVGENRNRGPEGAPSTTSRRSSRGPETWPSVGPSCTGDQLQLTRCAQSTARGEQRLLTAVLDDVRSHLRSADERAALAASQRQWSAYVAGFCAAINGGRGSISPQLAANCKAVLTHQRIIDVCQWAVPASDLDALVNPPETCRPYHE